MFAWNITSSICKTNASVARRRLCRNKSNTTKDWQSVVGLEIHAQISSESKLFSRSSTSVSSPINNNVSFFDSAIPGSLPVLNKRCVEAGILTALALNCRVNPVSLFDRKHYFYADLPAGYQITQQRMPLASDGFLDFQIFSQAHQKGYGGKCKLKQLQLEQDSGKSLHDTDRSLVDLNRAGVPLMELVFEPDLKDGEEAAALLKELILILQRIHTCSCKMEDGALRVDANVSVNKRGQPLGTRTEIKNIGSVRGVANAIKYEIERQIKLLTEGESVINETRAWDAVSKCTVPMRDKEEKQDYRYMPEPNLPPLHIATGPIKQGPFILDNYKKLIPELPKETRNVLIENYGLTVEHAYILVNEQKLLEIFLESLKIERIDPKLVAKILINDLLTILNSENIQLDELKLPNEKFAQLIKLLHEEKINRITEKLVLKELILGNTNDPVELITKNNWFQINTNDELMKLCESVLKENPSMVEQYKKGKKKVFKAILGQVALKSNQRANMELVVGVLKKMLE